MAFRLIHVAGCAACKVIVLGHNLTFWGCIAIPGVVFGVLTVKLEDAIIAMATAVTGSLAFGPDRFLPPGDRFLPPVFSLPPGETSRGV